MSDIIQRGFLAVALLASVALGGLALPTQAAQPAGPYPIVAGQPTVVTVSGYGPTRSMAQAAAMQAARQTTPYFRVKKETLEPSGAGWVCTMEIWVLYR